MTLTKYRLITGEVVRVVEGHASKIYNEKGVNIYYASDVDEEILKLKKMLGRKYSKGEKMGNEELFEQFIEEYLANIKRELPQSYRARQLEMGGIAAKAVYVYESKFLLDPFMKAIKEAKKNDS